jgi:uncharacterized damage-inducible protein DinB
MNESERLALELRKALNGEAWHGPSWRELLEGVTREEALERPIAGVHTIAEIVLHVTTWEDVARRRLEGETPEVSDAEDWPPPALPGESAWQATVERLFVTSRALRDTLARFPAERLHERRPGMDQTWYAMLIGELQHVLYHAGQVSLLKKAAVGASR